MSRLLKSKEFFGAIKVELFEKKVSDSRLTRGVPKTSPNRNPFNRQGEGSELIDQEGDDDFYQFRSRNEM